MSDFITWLNKKKYRGSRKLSATCSEIENQRPRPPISSSVFHAPVALVLRPFDLLSIASCFLLHPFVSDLIRCASSTPRVSPTWILAGPQLRQVFWFFICFAIVIFNFRSAIVSTLLILLCSNASTLLLKICHSLLRWIDSNCFSAAFAGICYFLFFSFLSSFSLFASFSLVCKFISQIFSFFFYFLKTENFDIFFAGTLLFLISCAVYSRPFLTQSAAF